jgi:ABC-type branched-subunit amino acid transport system substrate-binding protein
MNHRRFRIPGLAILAIALTWTPAEASETVKETFRKTYPLQSGGQLAVENRNGGITVEAWDRNEVQVEAIKQVKAASGERAREALKKIRIDVQSGAGSVRIATRLPKDEGDGFFDWITGNNINFSVTYKIKAPRQLASDLQSTNGGVRILAE